MSDATPPRRMRYSYEARCRAVAAMLAGAPTAESGVQVGASRATAYRWRARYIAESWSGLRERPSTPHSHPHQLTREAEAQILIASARALGRRWWAPSSAALPPRLGRR